MEGGNFMRSLKEKFVEVLARECHKHDIPSEEWYMEGDRIDWDFIKNCISEDDYNCKIPLAAFIADVFNELLNDLGSSTEIDTYHESVGYICERSIVYYLISAYHVPNVDWVLCWIDFFIKDGHFEEVAFVPFEYLIKPYFYDTADIKTGMFDLFYILKDRWERTGNLDTTERRVNEFLENL